MTISFSFSFSFPFQTYTLGGDAVTLVALHDNSRIDHAHVIIDALVEALETPVP